VAKKDKITQVSERIGKALGKADKKAHHHARRLSAVNKATKEELEQISKHVEALKKQLAKTTQRLKKVITA
jgi:DNA-binding ferritin-like protein